MPEVARFYGIIIAMYFDEQHQPHFHARYADFKAAFSIDPPALYAGAMPRRQQNMVLGGRRFTRTNCRKTGGVQKTVNHC